VLAVFLVLASLHWLIRWLDVVPEEFRMEESIQVLPSHPAFLYCAALLGFAAAVFADASVALLLPLSMAAIGWWLRPVVTRLQLRLLIPFAVLSLFATLLAIWNVRSDALLQLSSAGRRVGGLLLELLAPAPAVVNDLPVVSATWWGLLWTALAAGGVALLLLWLNRCMGRGIVALAALVAAALFAAALLRPPLLRASDVTIADVSAAYAASIPLLILAALGLIHLLAIASARLTGGLARWLPLAAAACVPLGLAAVSAFGVAPRFIDLKHLLVRRPRVGRDPPAGPPPARRRSPRSGPDFRRPASLYRRPRPEPQRPRSHGRARRHPRRPRPPQRGRCDLSPGPARHAG
jgi:hypothetical protein